MSLMREAPHGVGDRGEVKMSICRVCQKPTKRPKYCSDACQKKAWKLRNRDRYLAGKREYRGKNKSKSRGYLRLWRAANPDKVKQYRKKYDSKKRSD